ncbi:MAG: hypothetical protein AAF567_02815 [Actinomycetota bacterium]
MAGERHLLRSEVGHEESIRKWRLVAFAAVAVGLVFGARLIVDRDMASASSPGEGMSAEDRALYTDDPGVPFVAILPGIGEATVSPADEVLGAVETAEEPELDEPGDEVAAAFEIQLPEAIEAEIKEREPIRIVGDPTGVRAARMARANDGDGDGGGDAVPERPTSDGRELLDAFIRGERVLPD